MARLWPSLPTMSRRAAVAVGRGQWHTVIGGQGTDPEPFRRFSLAELAGDAGDARLAAPCADLLADRDEQVAGAAERALRALALRTAIAAGGCAELIGGVEREAALGLADPAVLDGDADLVYAAVASSCRRFATHRRRGVIEAAMILLDRSVIRLCGTGDGRLALGAWFNHADDEALAVLRTVLETTALPIARIRAMEWLDRRALAGACARKLRRLPGKAIHDPAIAVSHLMLRPARASAVRPKSAAPEPAPTSYTTLDSASKRGLPRFLIALGMSGPTCRRVLEWAVAEEDPHARFVAVGALPDEALADYCFDASSGIGRLAACRWACRPLCHDEPHGRARARFASLLTRSPDPWVRRLGVEVLDSSRGIWAGGVVGGLAAQRRLRANRDDLLRDLREALRGENEPDMVRAMALVRRVRLGDMLLDTLCEAAKDASARVAASACAALGDTRAEPARIALSQALRAADPRVRANAAEALARHQVRAGVLVEFKNDPHHRVRANIVRAGLNGRVEGYAPAEAVRSLLAMFDDPNPNQRRAGLWAASRRTTAALDPVTQREIDTRCTALARADTDASVRARAALVVDRARRLASMAEHAS